MIFLNDVFELYPFGVYTKQILDGIEEEMRTINVNFSIWKRSHFTGEKKSIFSE